MHPLWERGNNRLLRGPISWLERSENLMANKQNDPYNQGGQPQQPIILGKRNVQQEQQMQQTQRMPEAEVSGTQRQVEQPFGANQIASSGFGGTGRTSVAALQQTSGKREPFDMVDYILAIVAAVLIVATIVTVIVFSSIFHLSFAALSNNFARLLPYLLIYALCVAVGILWGRYQLDTASKRESIRLSGIAKQQNDEIERLNGENGKLQRDLFMTQSELAAMKNAPPPVLPQPGRSPSYAYSKVVEPPKIDRIQPQQSIYDVTRDPPDFNKREQSEHPHEKFYPERGKSWTMQSGWNIIGASRRGYGHAYDGKYREDDFEIKRFKVSTPGLQPTMIMVAIADGVSSKAYSRRGARAAVRGATSITSTSPHLLNLATCIGANTPFNMWQNAAFNALINHSVQRTILLNNREKMTAFPLTRCSQRCWSTSRCRLSNICLLPVYRLEMGRCLPCNWQREQHRANDGSGCNIRKFRQRATKCNHSCAPGRMCGSNICTPRCWTAQHSSWV